MISDMSVLLPARNEELTIGAVIDAALAEGVLPKHIIVGDNNSIDRTAFTATARRATVIAIPDRGKGHVIHELVKHIETPFALVVDSDCTYQIDGNVRRMRRLLDSNDAILTYREPSKEAMTVVHRIGNKGLSLLASSVYWTRIRDIVSGMWGFRTTVLDRVDIGIGGFTPDVDFVTGVIKAGVSIHQIPVKYYARPDGSKPKLHMLHGFAIAARIIERRFR